MPEVSHPEKTDFSYQPVRQSENENENENESDDSSKPLHSPWPATVPPHQSHSSQRGLIIALLSVLAVVIGAGLFFHHARSGPWALDSDCPCHPSDVPQYFQTTPELWPGITSTGSPAFMAQTRTFEPTATFVPNEPLQTAIPIQGMQPQDEGIFKNMGALTPYTPSPGFGVNEYPMPPGADIIQLQMLSRHGARYPAGFGQPDFVDKLVAAGDNLNISGVMSFLKDWKYQLGRAILVPKGRQELFDSGILHSYMYGQLYNPNSKIIVRTTTQDRMLKSAEYFLAGFFGLEWTNNATIEAIIEAPNFNNSLAGHLGCPNAQKDGPGSVASRTWVETYLQDATARMAKMVDGYQWNLNDTYDAQNMCAYETVAYGFSRFCELFTYEEWMGFEYSIDLKFSGNHAFQSLSGRAVGIGYQQEVMARLRNHTLGYSSSQINVTLDNNTETFPLNQTLYFDFSHDTNIISVLTAFGLKQFSEPLPTTHHPGPHNFTVSHITPFASRLDMEIIRAPQPVAADRSGYLPGSETKYIHFVLNQRTVPLGWSLPECDASRVDGWCELETFMGVQDQMQERAKFDEACFDPNNNVVPPYGSVSDGAPL